MYIYIYIHHNGKWKYDEIWAWKGLNRWCFRFGDSSGTYNIEKLFEFQEALCYSQGRLDMPKLLDAALLKSSRWYGHPDLHGITQLVYSTASSQQTVLGQGWRGLRSSQSEFVLAGTPVAATCSGCCLFHIPFIDPSYRSISSWFFLQQPITFAGKNNLKSSSFHRFPAAFSPLPDRTSEPRPPGALWNFPGSGPPVWHRDGQQRLLVAVTACEEYPEEVGFIHGQPQTHSAHSGAGKRSPGPTLGRSWNMDRRPGRFRSDSAR